MIKSTCLQCFIKTHLRVLTVHNLVYLEQQKSIVYKFLVENLKLFYCHVIVLLIYAISMSVLIDCHEYYGWGLTF